MNVILETESSCAHVILGEIESSTYIKACRENVDKVFGFRYLELQKQCIHCGLISLIDWTITTFNVCVLGTSGNVIVQSQVKTCGGEIQST